MNRRELMRAAIALPAAMLPLGALAAIPQDTNLLYCTNKIGLPCAFSPEIARDMMKVHRINIVELFSRKYGTTFHIVKSVSTKNGKQYLRFVLRTNDKRDSNQVWEISEGRFVRGTWNQIRRAE
jgi:hypothetical protein